MVFLTCSVSFRSISCRYFSKWQLKIFSGGNHPSYPQPSTLPYPRVRGTPGFFHQNDRKRCKRDYFDARSHFVLHFGAIGDIWPRDCSSLFLSDYWNLFFYLNKEPTYLLFTAERRNTINSYENSVHYFDLLSFIMQQGSIYIMFQW